MANNCLVTKLKAAVENDNLPVLGSLIIETTNVGAQIRMKTTTTSLLKILTSGVTFTNSGFSGETEQTITSAGARVISASGPCKILVNDKYNIDIIEESSPGYAGMDIDQLSYCSKLKTINLRNASKLKGNISALKQSTELQYISLYSSDIVGNIADLPSAPGLWGLIFSYSTTHANIEGDIVNLSKFPSLVDCSFDNISGIYGNVSVFSNNTFNSIRDLLFANTGLSGNVSSFANHSTLRSLGLAGTNVVGRLGDLLVNTPALKSASFPAGVEYTDADAAIADARMQANGGSLSPSSGHYFTGGTRVENY